MARARKIDLSSRKTPSQQRSMATEGNILAAARLLLTKHGYGAFNTNRIAQITGISVGSLYQYFPSKESIAARLVAEFFDNILVRNRQRTPLLLSLSIPLVLELASKMALEQKQEFKLYRILVEELPHEVNCGAIKTFNQAMIALLHERFQMRRDEIKVKNKFLAAYVVFHLFESVARSLDRFEGDVEQGEVLDELNRMIKAYLLG